MSEQAAWRILARGILLVFGLIILTLLLRELRPLVVQFLLAVLLAAAATPVVDGLTSQNSAGHRRWRPGRGLAAIAVFLAAVTLLVGAAVGIVVIVAADASSLATALPGYIAHVQDALIEAFGQHPELSGLVQGVLPSFEMLLSAATGVAGQVPRLVGIVTQLFSGVLSAFLTIILALYLTIDGDRLRRYPIQFLPPDRQAQALRVTENIGTRLGAWARGEVLLMTIIGALTWLAAVLIGVPYAAGLALIAGVGELIPTLGPILAGIPFVAIAFLSSPVQGLLALAAAVLIQQLENNLIVPRVMGQAVELHPVVVIGAILAGEQLLGVAGAVLAVPVAAALAVIIDEIRRERLAHNRCDQHDSGAPPGDVDTSPREHATVRP